MVAPWCDAQRARPLEKRVYVLLPGLVVTPHCINSDSDRVELLLHIIRKLGGYGITAEKLKEVAGDTKRSLKHPSHVEIIYEILRVRKMEERFERGEVGMYQTSQRLFDLG